MRRMRQATGNNRSACCVRIYIECPTDQFGALRHDRQAHSAFLWGRIGNSNPIIDDGEECAVVARVERVNG